MRNVRIGIGMMLVGAIAGFLSAATPATAVADGGGGFACVVDVVVETKSSTGLVVGREVYHKEFTLDEGATLFDDFSTRTRFKFFNAAVQKLDGDVTLAINWFADVSVFNSVDFDTEVTLSNGQKSGVSTGRHTLYLSSSSITTTYRLSCKEN